MQRRVWLGLVVWAALWAPIFASAAPPEVTPVAKTYKTYCQFYANGTLTSFCTNASVEDAKKACEERAAKEAGEPIECYCTDDPREIEDRCTEE